MSCLHIWDVNLLSVILFSNTFLPLSRLSFLFCCTFYFAVQKVISLIESHLFIYLFILWFILIFFNFYFYFILLYNTALVLPYTDMNLPRVYMSSQSWTPLPPPTPYHLSGSSPCTSPKHPVSCIEHRLAIRFLHDIIHVSVPFSQIIPPSPSPSESKSLFYTSVSLLLSRYRVIITIFLNSIYMC